MNTYLGSQTEWPMQQRKKAMAEQVSVQYLMKITDRNMQSFLITEKRQCGEDDAMGYTAIVNGSILIVQCKRKDCQ